MNMLKNKNKSQHNNPKMKNNKFLKINNSKFLKINKKLLN